VKENSIKVRASEQRRMNRIGIKSEREGEEA
jgi:hypothetical protein